MSGQGEKKTQSIESLVQELEEFCQSDALSLIALREKINQISSSSGAVQNSSFLHRACVNKRVTLAIVECILDAFPEAALARTNVLCPNGETTAYPLHFACYNASCPGSVIELLMEKNPSALSHLCVIDEGVGKGDYNRHKYAEGLPLHYHLTRESNMDISTIKMLVEAYPEALTTGDDETRATPIHTLVCNQTIGELYDILQFLVEAEPSSLRLTDGNDRGPLHIACVNTKIDSKIVKLILDVWPESILQRGNCGDLPIHCLCYNMDLDETASLEILELLIKMGPQSVMEANDIGYLPLHYAAGTKSLEFCKILIDASNKSLGLCKALTGAYSESLKVESNDEGLPIHEACSTGRFDTVKYLLELYPESIGMRTSYGYLPIHLAAGLDGKEKVKIIKFLLLQDPDGASKATAETCSMPLHVACGSFADLDVVQLLFDAHPSAICTNNGGGKTPLDIARRRAGQNSENIKVVNFLETQMTYARKAKDIIAMRTIDSNGWLPLHHALYNKAPLGAIKLLEKGNPSALRVVDYQGLLPLHIACEFSTADIVQFLVELNDSCLDNCDLNENFPLHYACRGRNCGVVKYLLESRVPSVSERNGGNKLPIHFLCESGNDEVDSESSEYVETIWCLLVAYPETVLNFN